MMRCVLVAVVSMLSGVALAKDGPATTQASTKPAAAWATSEDGALSLRIWAEPEVVGAAEPIVLVAEMRNNTKAPIEVLRPFGDSYQMMLHNIQIMGPNGKVPYSGPYKSYVLGAAAFARIEAGGTLRDAMKLPVIYFEKSNVAGAYSMVIRWEAGQSESQTAARAGFKNLWTGSIEGIVVNVRKK